MIATMIARSKHMAMALPTMMKIVVGSTELSEASFGAMLCSSWVLDVIIDGGGAVDWAGDNPPVDDVLSLVVFVSCLKDDEKVVGKIVAVDKRARVVSAAKVSKVGRVAAMELV